MNLHTDLYRATPPAALVTVPHRRWRTTFAALGMVTVLAIGAGVAAAALVDDGSGSVARPSTPAAAATNTADVETLWRWLAQLPAADRDQALAALVADPAGALEAIIAGWVATANTH